MFGTARQDARDDSFGQRAGTLILFLDDLHAQAGFDFIAVGCWHRCSQIGKVNLWMAFVR